MANRKSKSGRGGPHEDNYFSLLRGETKQVTIEFGAKDLSGNQVSVQVEGWNVTPAELARVQ